GGRQDLTVHRAKGRLYALAHRGPADGQDAPGTELWVYDLARRERVQRIALRSPGLTYLGVAIDPGAYFRPLGPLYELALSLAGLRTAALAVTQDERPLIVAGSEFSGALAIYDALSGAFLRRLAPGNITTLALQVPWETIEAVR